VSKNISAVNLTQVMTFFKLKRIKKVFYRSWSKFGRNLINFWTLQLRVRWVNFD